MKHFKIFSIAFLFLALLTMSLNPANAQSSQTLKYEKASESYADLADKAIRHIEKFQWKQFSKTISSDVEMYLPDGDAGTRTAFVGKDAVMGFWNSYVEKSGNSKIVSSNMIHLPVDLKQKANYSGIVGKTVVSYFSLEMHYGSEVTNIRMNWVMHFNDDNKIDRIYTYYDRTPIIAAAKRNLLAKN